MGRSYPHLSLEERRKIAKWREAKMPVPEIADRLGRAPSTVYRELKRNFFDDKELPELNGYHAVAAQQMYEQRRALHRKMIVHPELKEAVEDRLKAGWSPEQIAGRMRLERHPVRVAPETRIPSPGMELIFAFSNDFAPMSSPCTMSISPSWGQPMSRR